MKINIIRTIDKQISPEKIINQLLEDRGITDKKIFLNPPHPDKFDFFDIFENKKRDFEKTIKLLKTIKENNTFVSIASDGLDNSDSAGAIIDSSTRQKIKSAGIDIDKHLETYDTYSVLNNSGDLIFTGPTGANVADLMLLLKDKE